MPTGSLSDARWKIKGANQKVQQLNVAVQAFSKTKPYRIVKELDFQTGLYDTKARLKGVIPDNVRAHTNEIIESLRSALDYVAAKLRDKNGVASNVRVFFPFNDTRTEFELAKRQGVIQAHFGATALALLNDLQPYPTGKGEDLWTLNKINNVNKHERLVAIGSSVKSISILPGYITSKGRGLYMPVGLWQPLEKSAVLYSGDTGSKIEPEPEVAVDVAFREVRLFENEPVVLVASRLIKKVRSVLDRFDTEIFSLP